MSSASSTSPPNPPPQYRILVISADPEVCAAVKAAWNPSDQVFCVPDGQSGVTLCQEQTPDLVILDDTLPDQDGLRVLEQLRSGRADLPVIAVATKPSLSADAMFVKAGVYDYLSKPLDRGLLHVVMRETLKHGTLKRQVVSH